MRSPRHPSCANHLLERGVRPVAILHHTLEDAEERCDTGDQEFLALIIALNQWDVHFHGRFFVLRTDHELIRSAQSKQKLSGRQARWLDLLQSYCFEVMHITGKDNIPADTLGLRPDHASSVRRFHPRDDDLGERIYCAYASMKERAR